eukprot:TRINITY_DN23700_c0_g1_i2.p1 TRINITY_DN23700_c0_g1~~TRINITY_DN23700_c0_g1_i2.p1  ORF type:complete len:427 (+),score=90.78 TRINITY_DN23700_c0_g1_i2:57-1283(+)
MESLRGCCRAARLRREWALQSLEHIVCNSCPCADDEGMSNSSRLGCYAVVAGGAAATASMLARRPWASLLYCLAGWVQAFPRLRPALAACAAAAAALALLELAPWELLRAAVPAALVALSELCWLPTIQEVLDRKTEFFIGAFWAFLSTSVTFAGFPLALEVASSPRVAERARQAVRDAEARSEEAGVDDSFHGQLILLGVLVGLPLLAGVIFVYWWICENVPRMLLYSLGVFAVAVFCLVAIDASRIVVVSPLLWGKLVLSVVSVIAFRELAQLVFPDADEVRMLVRGLLVLFTTVLVVDTVLPAAPELHLRPTLYLALVLICKLPLRAQAQALSEGVPLRVGHTLPVWFRKRRWRFGAAARGVAGANGEASGVAEELLAVHAAASAEAGAGEEATAGAGSRDSGHL